MSTIRYRADIDGLRAIAVLSVILFHINPSWLPNGFLGVDIFFVLSGYLITKIINDEMCSGTFSFIEFYKRRAKRILPVFVLVLSATTIAAAFLLLKHDFFQYLKSATASLFFVANIFFARRGDYFDSSSSERPLLHIWSLSVEEQFYFFFPIFLLLCIKYFRNKVPLMISVLIVLSILSQFLPAFGMEKYYLLQIRAYELLIGALFVFVKPRHTQKRVPLILFLTLIAIMFLPKDTLPANGYIERLAICFITGLLILFGYYRAQDNSDWVYRLLSSKMMVSIGLISYSLYLWHWVILSLLRYVYMDNVLPPHIIITAVIAMFALAYASFRLVENPIRRMKGITNKQFAGGMLAYFLLIVPVGGLIYYTDKAADEQSHLTWELTGICHDTVLDSGCAKGDTRLPPNILIAGDSHAGQYNMFINEVGKKEGWSADLISSNTCAVAIGFRLPPDNRRAERCNAYVQYIENNINKYQTVMFMERWMIYLQYKDFLPLFEQTLQDLIKQGKEIYVFKDNPLSHYPVLRKYHLEQRGIFIDYLTESRKQEIENNHKANVIIKQIVDKYPEVHWVDLSEFIPNDFMSDNLPVYRDYDHFNPYGAQKLALEFIELQRLLKKQ
ncbi:acyltransferase family protein [Glaesserella sp.]|uniref:acyltransferase family protein n=1 Tax=Glaesserella sp. TaxID=2094731 RepID=UPI0035A12B71